MRFWNLHGEKSLVVKEPKRTKLKILSSSLSYAEYKKKQKKNKKLTTFFKTKNSKLTKRGGRDISRTIVKQQDPPLLLESTSIVSDTDLVCLQPHTYILSQTTNITCMMIYVDFFLLAFTQQKTNGYLYLEVMELNGQWKGVKYQKSITKLAHEENDNITNEKSEAEPAAAAPASKVDDEEKTLVSNSGNGNENKEDGESDTESDSDADEVNENILSQGVIGLQNLGNTCYLNAAVQCLSHSTPLTQYFLSNVFVHEINKTNFMGNQGRVACAFAALLRAAWNSKPYSIHTPRNLKALVTLVNPLFEGRMQHDSQEALQTLLEGVHQDLNRVKERPKGLQVNDSEGRRDEIVAKEAWDVSTAREQSVVSDLFMGQFRSTTKCLECGRENHKFDCYQMVSLPIPTFDAKFIHIIVFFYNAVKKPVKYSLRLGDQTTIEHVLGEVAKLTGIERQLLVPCHIIRNSIYQQIPLVKRITQIQLSDVVIFYEAPHWVTLERKERGVYCAPPGRRPGMFLDVKDPKNNRWYEGEIVDMVHESNWNISMQSSMYTSDNDENDSKHNNDAKAKNSGDKTDDKEITSGNNEQTPLLSDENENENDNGNDGGDDKDETAKNTLAEDHESSKDTGNVQAESGNKNENENENNNKNPSESPAQQSENQTVTTDGNGIDNEKKNENGTSKENVNDNVDEKENKDENGEAPYRPWGKWKIKIHYSDWDDEWDEWIDNDDTDRLQPCGKYNQNVASTHKYPIRYQDIPYHVLPLKMIHRRLIKVKSENTMFREYNPFTFGVPFMCFLPRFGFTSQEFYHYVWNFVQFRYLFHSRTSVLNQNANMFQNRNGIDNDTSENSNEKKQQQRIQTEYFDQFNNISNAYFQIFSGNMYNDNNSGSNDDDNKNNSKNDNESRTVWWRKDGNMHPPFVLRTVSKFGRNCSRSTWDKYSIGHVVPYKTDDMGADHLDFDENRDYIAIDWNDDFFNSFLMVRQKNIDKMKGKDGIENDDKNNDDNDENETKTTTNSKEENKSKDGVVNEEKEKKVEISEKDIAIEKEIGLRGDMALSTIKNGRKAATNEATSFLNGMTLVFEEILEDSSMKEHFSLYNKPISIGDCVREFQKEEKLSEYYCSNCDKKIDATKSLRIWSTPPILILHLKRVGSMGRKINTHVDYLLHNFDVSPFLVPRTVEPGKSLEEAIKQDDEEEAKKRLEIEIEKELEKNKPKPNETEKDKENESNDEDNENENKNKNDNEKEKDQEKKEEKENILDKLENEKKENEKEEEEEKVTKKWENVEWTRYPVASSPQTHYNLFGAIQHYGAAGGGHYTAQCLCNDVNSKSPNGNTSSADGSNASISNIGVGNNKKWYLFDDHRVRAISPLDVKSKNAYLLFYVRSDLQEIFFNKMNLMSRKMTQDENAGGGGNDKSGKKGKSRNDYDNPSFNVDLDELEQQFEFLPINVQQLVCNCICFFLFVCFDCHYDLKLIFCVCVCFILKIDW